MYEYNTHLNSAYTLSRIYGCNHARWSFQLNMLRKLAFFPSFWRIVDEQTKWLFIQRRATSNDDDDHEGDDTRQRRNWTKNGTSSSRKLMLVTSSSSYMLSTTISIALLSIVSNIPQWREMWHMFTTPPKACGDFLVAVKHENQRVKQQSS